MQLLPTSSNKALGVEKVCRSKLQPIEKSASDVEPPLVLPKVKTSEFLLSRYFCLCLIRFFPLPLPLPPLASASVLLNTLKKGRSAAFFAPEEAQVKSSSTKLLHQLNLASEACCRIGVNTEQRTVLGCGYWFDTYVLTHSGVVAPDQKEEKEALFWFSQLKHLCQFTNSSRRTGHTLMSKGSSLMIAISMLPSDLSELERAKHGLDKGIQKDAKDSQTSPSSSSSSLSSPTSLSAPISSAPDTKSSSSLSSSSSSSSSLSSSLLSSSSALDAPIIAVDSKESNLLSVNVALTYSGIDDTLSVTRLSLHELNGRDWTTGGGFSRLSCGSVCLRITQSDFKVIGILGLPHPSDYMRTEVLLLEQDIIRQHLKDHQALLADVCDDEGMIV